MAGVLLGVAAVMGMQLTATRYYQGEKVIEVVDGDTFITEKKQPIRSLMASTMTSG